MHISYPKGFTEENFKRRMSGTQLMEKCGLSLPEIQALPLQAYKETVRKTEIEPSSLQSRNMEAKLLRALSRVIREMRQIKPFLPESIDDMPNCFYRLEDIEKLGGLFFLLSNGEESFPGHPLGKPNKEDPLFVAVKVRTALMNGLIEEIPGCAPKAVLEAWIEANYPGVSKRQRPHIASIVNDGHGRGKKTKFKKV